MNKCTRKCSVTGNDKGFTLIEVLIGILIFAVGMLALAQLQTNLARNSSDSNARTVATNIAEELIEAARTFGQIDSGGGRAAYNDIVDAAGMITRENNEYNWVTNVTDYYYVSDSEPFTIDKPIGAARSDFKLVELTVTWNDAQEFQIDQVSQTEGRLGSGSIQLSDVISSITTGSGGKVVLNTTGTGSYAPPVDYTPGEIPDIISIQLDTSKFKESTTPLPDVIRQDELVETKFDVVTYSQDDEGATFLRREEFRAVSCDCKFPAAPATGAGGLRPAIWEGYEYTEPEFIAKVYGENTDNVPGTTQSALCDVCCRDHHDGGTAASADTNDDPLDPGRSLYAPFRLADRYYGSTGDYPSLAGDHLHYKRSQNGTLSVAGPGESYLEACRLIRKDGYFRVAQNLRQEGLNSFPADYMDDEEDPGIGEYSKYVTDSVSVFALNANYESTPPTLTPPVGFPASESDPTYFPTIDGDTEQQLRARGIYIDYMSDVLRERIACLSDTGKDPASCGVPNVQSALEVIPFYDVQLTWLASWNESPTGIPIEVTNQRLEDNNAHSRGWASLNSGRGPSKINSAVHKGNLGLTGTDPIDPWYVGDEANRNLYALAVDWSTQPKVSPDPVSGTITSASGGPRAVDVEITSSDAVCDRTNTGFECNLLLPVNSTPILVVSNYDKAGKTWVACSSVLVPRGQEHINLNGSGSWTKFEIPLGTVTNADIVIKQDTCN